MKVPKMISQRAGTKWSLDVFGKFGEMDRSAEGGKTPLQRRLGDLRLEASSQSGPGTGKQTSQDGGNVTV